MNGIQPIHFTHFSPPSSEPLLRTHSLVVWVLNIITIGIYGSAECLEKQYRIKELKLQQADVQQQVQELLKEWESIESKVATIAKAVDHLDSREQQKIKSCQDTLDSVLKPELEREFTRLKAKEIKTNEIYDSRFSQILLDTISFVGLLLANILTAGLYGVYQYNKLSNQVKLLTDQNDFICETAGILNEEKQDAVEQQVGLASKNLELMGEKYNPDHEEASQAYEEAKQAKKKVEEWRKKQSKIKGDLGALQTNLVQFQTAEQTAYNEYTNKVAPQVNQLRVDNQKLTDERNAIKIERDRLKAEKDARDQNIANLRRQVNAIKPALSAQELQKQANKLKIKYNKLSAEQKLQKQLGPIPPKYTKRFEDGNIIGAICTTGEDADKDKIATFDEKKQADFEAYAKRYTATKIERFDAATRQVVVDVPAHKSAASLVEAGFDYVFQQIIDQEDKFKLTKSSQTKDTAGAKTVYRAIMWDLLSGAKLHSPTCHGFELRINGDVNMYPSHAEKVMQYETDDTGALKAGVAVRYQRKDDFTPTADQLKKEQGVDPVSAKWILEQLSDEEKDILYHLLMAPVMENTHADYQTAVEFISNKEDPRVKLVKTAYELIADLADAIDVQFKDTVLAQCWQKHANDDAVQPFEKDDDVKVIEEEPELVQEEEVKTPKIRIGDPDERVRWTINQDVLGIKQAGGRYTQVEFTKLVENAQAKHEGMFSILSDDLLLFTHEKEEIFEWLEWDAIRQQYYVAHSHIQGQHDVFANLLATLCTDKKDLTEDNVRKLKKAMAAFLDDPQHANAFAPMILEKYNLPVADYQSKLRGNNPRPLAADKVGPLEIQLAAYTLGVRIGVLAVEEAIDAEIDRYGKIVPKEDYYGPNTEVVLLMVKHQNNFYGLFPKLNLDGNPALDFWIKNDMLDLVCDLGVVHSYWQAIDSNSDRINANQGVIPGVIPASPDFEDEE